MIALLTPVVWPGAGIQGQNIPDSVSDRFFVHDLHNPGAPLNSKGDELYPSITGDGNTILFNSRRGGRSYHDIFVSTRNENGEWSTPRALDAINSPYNDETPYITPQGDLLLFASDRDGSTESEPDSLGRVRVSYDLYWSKKMGDTWSTPQRIPGDVNTSEHERFPSLSPDRKTLYYTSWPFGKIDKTTIKAARLKDGRFEQRGNLAPEVNSGNNEVQYVYDSDREGFFFSSRRGGGLGGWDLYFTHQDATDGKASKSELTVNPGSPLNSPGHELGIGVYQDGEVISSDRPGGLGGYDIYLSRYTKSKKDKKAQVHLRVVHAKTGEPLSDAKVRIIAVQIQKTDAKTTSHEIQKKSDSQGRVGFQSHPIVEEVRIVVRKEGFMPYAENNPVAELKKKSALSIPLTPMDEGESFDIRAINFEPNSATLREESFPFLDSMVDFLKENQQVKLEIIGHTDLHGSESYNRLLSIDRAKAVRDYLVDRGIDIGRLRVSGKGKSNPIIDETGPEADPKNRRTEFKIMR